MPVERSSGCPKPSSDHEIFDPGAFWSVEFAWVDGSPHLSLFKRGNLALPHDFSP